MKASIVYLEGLPAPDYLEALGFTMTSETTGRRRHHHILLRPKGFKIVGRADGPRSVWETYDLDVLDPRETRQCLWDFITLAPAPSASVPQTDIPMDETWKGNLDDFVKKWGLLDHGTWDG